MRPLPSSLPLRAGGGEWRRLREQKMEIGVKGQLGEEGVRGAVCRFLISFSREMIVITAAVIVAIIIVALLPCIEEIESKESGRPCLENSEGSTAFESGPEGENQSGIAIAIDLKSATVANRKEEEARGGKRAGEEGQNAEQEDDAKEPPTSPSSSLVMGTSPLRIMSINGLPAATDLSLPYSRQDGETGSGEAGAGDGDETTMSMRRRLDESPERPLDRSDSMASTSFLTWKWGDKLIFHNANPNKICVLDTKNSLKQVAFLDVSENAWSIDRIDKEHFVTGRSEI